MPCLADARGIRTWRHWDIDPDYRIYDKDERQYVEHFLEIFQDAVRCRVRARFGEYSLVGAGVILSRDLSRSLLLGEYRGEGIPPISDPSRLGLSGSVPPPGRQGPLSPSLIKGLALDQTARVSRLGTGLARFLAEFVKVEALAPPFDVPARCLKSALFDRPVMQEPQFLVSLLVLHMLPPPVVSLPRCRSILVPSSART